jgi:5'-nucleotidase / UDP-sugar diphosphatase
MAAFPFWNTVAFVKLKGDDLMAALQNGVSRVGEATGTGRFLHPAGLRYVYNPTRAAGLRVLSVEVWTRGGWVKLTGTDTYSIATMSFLRQGGDGYAMMADASKAIDPYDNGIGIDQAMAEFVTHLGSLNYSLDGRIQVSNGTAAEYGGSCTYTTTIQSLA